MMSQMINISPLMLRHYWDSEHTLIFNFYLKAGHLIITTFPNSSRLYFKCTLMLFYAHKGKTLEFRQEWWTVSWMNPISLRFTLRTSAAGARCEATSVCQSSVEEAQRHFISHTNLLIWPLLAACPLTGKWWQQKRGGRRCQRGSDMRLVLCQPLSAHSGPPKWAETVLMGG